VLLGAAIAVTVIAIVVVGVFLVRGPGEAAVNQPPPQEDTTTLRTEALEAASTFFPRQQRAYAAGDIRLLDGIFVPGSLYEQDIQIDIKKWLARGELIDKKSRTTDVELVSLDAQKAQVRFTYAIVGGATRDAKTKKVKVRYARSKEIVWRIFLVRVNGRWLVDGLETEESVLKGGAP
jgi:hypothetical protein